MVSKALFDIPSQNTPTEEEQAILNQAAGRYLGRVFYSAVVCLAIIAFAVLANNQLWTYIGLILLGMALTAAHLACIKTASKLDCFYIKVPAEKMAEERKVAFSRVSSTFSLWVEVTLIFCVVLSMLDYYFNLFTYDKVLDGLWIGYGLVAFAITMIKTWKKVSLDEKVTK